MTNYLVFQKLRDLLLKEESEVAEQLLNIIC